MAIDLHGNPKIRESTPELNEPADGEVIEISNRFGTGLEQKTLGILIAALLN